METSSLGRIIWSPQGTELSRRECDWLAHKSSAGLILFSDNYESPAQLRSLTAQVKHISPQALLSIDQEGGRVQRLERHFTRLPQPALIGELYQEEREKARALAEAMGRVTAMELRECGITMNYAPVLDRNLGISQVIGNRSWGKETAQVIDLAAAYIHGLNQGGVIAVGKHFPGHGGVAMDSHHTLPCDKRSEKEIRADMRPFAVLAAQLPCLMTAHIVYAAMDPLPATFSPFWLREQLRSQLHYQGLILGDDLCMGAVKEKYESIEKALEQAVSSGCDLLMLCQDHTAVEKALDFADKENLPPLSAAQLRKLQPPQPADGFDREKDGALLASL